MFDIMTKYQSSMFIDAPEIIPTPDSISSMLSLFKKEGFLPTTFQEIDIINPVPKTKLRLKSQDNEWSIDLGSKRIDINKHISPVNAGNLGDINDFGEKSADFVSRILKKYKKKGNRISVISSGLLNEMTKDQLDSVYKKLFCPLPFYNTALPFEWKSRVVSKVSKKIGKKNDLINIITNINRVRGEITTESNVLEFDRIELNFDINTSTENSESRFTAVDFNDFIAISIELRSGLLNEIKEIIYG